MISPHTPPGTKVVCIQENHIAHHLPKLIVGETYTIDKMVHLFWINEICVELVGIDHTEAAYSRHIFRLAALPDCLTGLLEGEKVPTL